MFAFDDMHEVTHAAHSTAPTAPQHDAPAGGAPGAPVADSLGAAHRSLDGDFGSPGGYSIGSMLTNVNPDEARAIHESIARANGRPNAQGEISVRTPYGTFPVSPSDRDRLLRSSEQVARGYSPVRGAYTRAPAAVDMIISPEEVAEHDRAHRHHHRSHHCR